MIAPALIRGELPGLRSDRVGGQCKAEHFALCVYGCSLGSRWTSPHMQRNAPGSLFFSEKHS